MSMITPQIQEIEQKRSQRADFIIFFPLFFCTIYIFKKNINNMKVRLSLNHLICYFYVIIYLSLQRYSIFFVLPSYFY